MDGNTVFVRTPKGNEEVEKRTHKINIRLRAALLAVNGNESVAAIIKRFHGLEEIATSLRDLEAQGFVVAVAAPKVAAAAGARDASFDQKLRTVVGLVHELLGPGGDAVAERIEDLGAQLKQTAPVLHYLEQRKDLFEGTLGKQKSADFFERVRKLLGPPA
jgi:hypothetical protein